MLSAPLFRKYFPGNFVLWKVAKLKTMLSNSVALPFVISLVILYTHSLQITAICVKESCFSMPWMFLRVVHRLIICDRTENNLQKKLLFGQSMLLWK